MPANTPVISFSDFEGTNILPHPRLFGDASRFAALRTPQDTVAQQLFALLQSEAEAKLVAETLVYPAEGFIIYPVREVQGRILTLAMAYRLTGERRFFERAREDLLQLAHLPAWCPSHFLDTGEAALAAGIGLDWLYDDLSPAERDQIAHAIIHHALLPSLEVKEGVSAWVDSDSNWSSVCHAGLVVGALAVAEREPALCRTIVERAVRCVPNAEATYAPSGAYPEGPSYWIYGTTFHVILTEALRSVFGTSLGIGESEAFLRTADFVRQMVGATGQDYNFADYHAENLHKPVMLWFARERRDRNVAETELEDIADLYEATQGGNRPVKNRSRHLALALLWWDNTLPHTEDTLPLHWTANGKIPVATLRSAWNDPKATYVAVKGGTPNASHAHMDVGSFVLEANGVRWAVDLGTENYNLMRAAKIKIWNYAQDSTHWTTFRVGPEGHNLLRFDGKWQDVTGKAEIRVLPPEPDAVGNVVELTPLYRNQVTSVERRLRLHSDRTVTIEDVWTTGEQSVEVSWQWLTKATVTPSAGKRGVVLHQGGEVLSLVVEPENVAIDIEDVSAPKNPQDSPNLGLTRLVMRLSTPAHTTATLRVRVIPGNTEAI